MNQKDRDFNPVLPQCSCTNLDKSLSPLSLRFVNSKVRLLFLCKDQSIGTQKPDTKEKSPRAPSTPCPLDSDWGAETQERASSQPGPHYSRHSQDQKEALGSGPTATMLKPWENDTIRRSRTQLGGYGLVGSENGNNVIFSTFLKSELIPAHHQDQDPRHAPRDTYF